MLEKLKEFIRKYNSAGVAFSGGTDSAFLLAVCKEVLGDNVWAITANVPSLTTNDLRSSKEIISLLDVKSTTINLYQFNIPKFPENTHKRCYFCKKAILTEITTFGKEHNLDIIFDGANASDNRFYRPGAEAARELGVVSPLKKFGFTKEDIRHFSKEIYNLPTHDKPSDSCLVTRIPYNESITPQKLEIIREMEDYIHGLIKTPTYLRCAIHGNLLRIDISENLLKSIMKESIRKKILEKAKTKGFSLITLDIEGFSTGKMDRKSDL